ncbi:MAG: hypothetical protein HY321_00345 [Armatimonadetes bacterium]|nr:hypothetical protein [Armatimonadota bacterium]
MALLLVSCALPAAAEWQVTPTATGFGPDPNALRQDCYREVDGQGYHGPPAFPLQDTQSLHINYHVQWVGGGTPLGVQNNTIKVKLRVTGGTDAWAQPYWTLGTEPPYDMYVGQCAATTSVWTSLNGGVTVTAEAVGLDPFDPEYDTAQLDQTQIRTLTLDENHAADTAVDISRTWSLTETGGYAWGDADIGCVLSLSVVQLISPSPSGDPTYDGDNEYLFTWAMLGWLQDVHFPYLPVPFTTRVIAGDANDLAQYGRIQWATSRSWANPLTRIYPNNVSVVEQAIRPWCEDPIQPPQPMPLVGMAFGQQDYLPASNSDFGPFTVSISVAEDVNLEGGATANAEAFYDWFDNHHPGTGHLETPNWFYYYSQVYPAADAVYEPGSPSSYTDGTIYIRDDAHGGLSPDEPGSKVACFYKEDGLLKMQWTEVNNEMWVDTLRVSGIHAFVAVLEHERAHKRLVDAGKVSHYFTEEQDRDTDTVLDQYEDQVGLNKDEPDSTWFLVKDPDYPEDTDPAADAECLAMILSLPNVLAQESLWQQDWASDGLQTWPRQPEDVRFPWIYYFTEEKNPCESHVHVTTLADF